MRRMNRQITSINSIVRKMRNNQYILLYSLNYFFCKRPLLFHKELAFKVPTYYLKIINFNNGMFIRSTHTFLEYHHKILAVIPLLKACNLFLQTNELLKIESIKVTLRYHLQTKIEKLRTYIEIRALNYHSLE